jgi:hypothetical protein
VFHTDDAMFMSKAVARLPAEDRLEALGLWQTVGQWSAHEAADGYCTLDQVHQLSPLGKRRTNRLIELLVDVARLWQRVDWDGRPSVLFTDWDVWQDTVEQVKKRRNGWRDAKRRQRASKESTDTKKPETSAKLSRNFPEKTSKLSPKNPETSESNDADQSEPENVLAGHDAGHTPRVPTPLIPSPYLSNHSPKQQANVSNAQAANEPQPHTRTFGEMTGAARPAPPPPDLGPHSMHARSLVKAVIPNDYPADERGKLAHHAGRLLDEGTEPNLVEAALQLWLTKPHAGPALLPSLVSEVLKTSHPTNGAPASMGRASAKAQGILDAGARLAARFDTDQPGIEAP